MITMYPACFYKEKDGYSVIFPDLNGTATCGDSLDDAMSMAVECLAGYICSEWEDGNEAAPASDIRDIDPVEYIRQELSEYNEYEDCFVAYVSVDVKEYAEKHFNKCVKKTLTIPIWLNRQVNRYGINCSQVLKKALIAELKERKEGT